MISRRNEKKSVGLLWPPIESVECLNEWVPRISWFFCDEFDHLVIIVKDIENYFFKIPEHASLGAIVGLKKVRIISVESLTDDLIDNSLILIHDLKAGFDRKFNLKPIVGSKKVEFKSPANCEKDLPYYFIGGLLDKDDAYLCVVFHYWYHNIGHDQFLHESAQRLASMKELVATNNFRVNLFGTGPSIIEAEEADFYCGEINLICNSIVKNRNFIKKLRPSLVFMSDAHFHFSYHIYSSAMLSDLIDVLGYCNCFLVTFDKFAVFLRKKFPLLSKKIIAVPADAKNANFFLESGFSVKPAESVVNMFMLPVAGYLASSKGITMSGFTGRSKTDTYFWAHSESNQYTTFLPHVRAAHPGFFKERDYDDYNSKVDEQIEARIAALKDAGMPLASKTRSFYKAFSDISLSK